MANRSSKPTTTETAVRQEASEKTISKEAVAPTKQAQQVVKPEEAVMKVAASTPSQPHKSDPSLAKPAKKAAKKATKKRVAKKKAAKKATSGTSLEPTVTKPAKIEENVAAPLTKSESTPEKSSPVPLTSKLTPAEGSADSPKISSAKKPRTKPVEPEPKKEEAEEITGPLHNVFLHSDVPSMNIVHIASEITPVSKVGGLADVVFGLTQELAIRGNSVEIILPKYDNMRYDHIHGLCIAYKDLWVPWYDGAIHCTVYFGHVYDRKCFFIEPHSRDNFFNRGKYYGEKDDIFRFAFFSRAAMEFLLKSCKRPDLIHCHDWHTGLAPVFQWEIYQHLGMGNSRVCYTIHNFKHQGLCGPEVLRAAGLNRPEYYYDGNRLGDHHNKGALNLMKGGIVYANFVTTVSPTHAGEVRDKGQGFGLEGTLHAHSRKFGGVLNGIDYNAWNPGGDGLLRTTYNVETIEKKYENKKALRERFLLADNEKPIIAHIGRLDPQKGLELVRHAIFYCVNHGAQFVLLGSSPEPSINSYFWHLKNEINENPDCHLEIGFNEELAHQIYAGADMMLVPSRFEPCGLTQLISMRYGTVPVVRSVGGLADTVFDKDFSNKELSQRNGYVFEHDNHASLESALSRALSCYYEYPDHFRHLIKNAMLSDYSWNVPGQHYLNIYNYIRCK